MVDQLTNHFIGVLSDCDLTPMDECQTLSGIPEWENSKPMDVRTTAGEPFARMGRSVGLKKNAFLKVENAPNGKKLYTFNEQPHTTYLVNAINKKEEMARKGIRTLSLWKNCLKDETRPFEKCKIGKTRLFTAAPFDVVYLGRKYFGKFKENWQENRFKLFHGVGINPVSSEWSVLAKKLLEKGSDFSDADYSSYDGYIRADFARAAGKIVINTIMSVAGGERTLLETLWEEYVETFHVSGRTIQLVGHGNPSGNPMTTVLNCIVNLLHHWWCYRKITNKESLCSFIEDVGFTSFGDDVVYSTVEDVTGYTFNAVAQWMAVLGQQYTTAAKDGCTSFRKTIEDISFLKRKFVVRDHMYWAPLETDSIEQQFNWTYIGENDISTIRQQLEEACLEAAIHGKAYYRKFKSSLDSALRADAQLKTIGGCLTYSDALNVVTKRYQD
jgi:hypothetical protein